jgi:hypothetical protein
MRAGRRKPSVRLGARAQRSRGRHLDLSECLPHQSRRTRQQRVLALRRQLQHFQSARHRSDQRPGRRATAPQVVRSRLAVLVSHPQLAALFEAYLLQDLEVASANQGAPAGAEAFEGALIQQAVAQEILMAARVPKQFFAPKVITDTMKFTTRKPRNTGKRSSSTIGLRWRPSARLIDFRSGVIVPHASVPR